MKPHYVRIFPGEPLPDISAYAQFKAVIALSAEYSADWQKEVSDWLVACGCRYMMAWGPNSSSWDDSVDWADLEARDFEDDDSRFVRTTWHNNETLESVFWYAQFCEMFSYDDVELKETIIVDIGDTPREEELLSLWEQSKTLADHEDPHT